MKATWALALFVSAWSATASAATCGRPDLIETFPSADATGVPPNARLFARYASTAEYLNEPISLEHVAVGPEEATSTFDANEGLLSVVPKMPLVAGDKYKISWPALRGLTTAALGTSAEVTFESGSLEDTEAPRFDGARGLAWDIERYDDDCTDAPEDRYRFDVSIGDATDDGPRDMLALVVFQTSGPQSSGSPEPVFVGHLPERGKVAEVRRPIESAIGRICFAALVRDSLGRTSNSADHEVCVTTVRPPFFYGCALARGRGSSSVVMGVVMAVSLAWRSRRRRRGAT